MVYTLVKPLINNKLKYILTIKFVFIKYTLINDKKQ